MKSKQIRFYGVAGHSFIFQPVLKNNDITITDVFNEDLFNHHLVIDKELPNANINMLDFPFKGDPFTIGIGIKLKRA
jgi:hypothetical protein